MRQLPQHRDPSLPRLQNLCKGHFPATNQPPHQRKPKKIGDNCQPPNYKRENNTSSLSIVGQVQTLDTHRMLVGKSPDRICQNLMDNPHNQSEREPQQHESSMRVRSEMDMLLTCANFLLTQARSIFVVTEQSSVHQHLGIRLLNTKHKGRKETSMVEAFNMYHQPHNPEHQFLADKHNLPRSHMKGHDFSMICSPTPPAPSFIPNLKLIYVPTTYLGSSASHTCTSSRWSRSMSISNRCNYPSTHLSQITVPPAYCGEAERWVHVVSNISDAISAHNLLQPIHSHAPRQDLLDTTIDQHPHTKSIKKILMCCASPVLTNILPVLQTGSPTR
ncbi:hypothetical protein QBC36DRAFT_354203 [Triangularia setosa]|uniref:Uncharacterized protein n=1 Tax=Triangularia setosa TaxID=2587417 RepID=A0AAN6W628_9PEZI|nr:hypothetical protein QBC36DRAFT_354203 [Podospora setosa]